jgi:hypothetical protein
MWLASKDHGRPPGVIILHVVGKVLILRAELGNLCFQFSDVTAG